MPLTHDCEITPELRDEWLAYRPRSIGGSVGASLMTKSMWGVWNSIVNPEPTEEDRLEWRVGLYLEPLIEQLFQEQTGQQVNKRQLFLIESSHTHATIDGMTHAGPTDWKSVSGWQTKDWGEYDNSDHVPDRVLWQCQHNLRVSANSGYPGDEMFVGALFLPHKFRVYVVRRNDDLQEVQIEREAILAQSLESGNEPVLTEADEEYWARKTRKALGEIELVGQAAITAARFAELKESIKLLEDEKDAMDVDINRILGDYKSGVFPGGKFTRVHVDAKEPVMKLAGGSKEKNYVLFTPKKPKKG